MSTTTEKKKSFLKSALDKFKKSKFIDIAGNALSYTSRVDSMVRGRAAEDDAIDMFTRKIPVGISDEMKKYYSGEIEKLVRKGNYLGARNYVKQFTDNG